MTTRKFGRTALIAVLALSIIMSITGGTIAWFTDEVTSANNVITAGNLDVDVYYGEATEEKSIENVKELFKVDLWEPGVLAYENLTVVNKGNLALKYEMTINGGTMQSTKAASAENDVMYTYSFGNSHANTSVTINGGSFLGGTVSIGSGYKGDAPKLTINGGTFEYDMLQWLANDGSTVLYNANK